MPPSCDEHIFSIMDEQFVVRSHGRARLGPLSIEIRSNEAHFAGLRYLPADDRPRDGSEADYTLSFCNLRIDGPWLLQMLQEARDLGYRAGRFAAGYYITDHFGAPAYLISRDKHYWVFGENFEPIFWPYFVKYLLTIHSMEQGMLHLKAAGVAMNGLGTVLVGRGGSGKTVLLTRLCQQGAQFLSNTHLLVNDQTMIAIPSVMRIRRDSLFGPMIAERNLPEGIKRGEYIADPFHDLGWQAAGAAPLKNICLVDYRGPGIREIRPIEDQVLFEYMEQFSLALNVYGLKEDVLDHLSGDVTRFSAQVSRMKTMLRATVERCNGYYVSCDITDTGNLNAVSELLAAGVS